MKNDNDNIKMYLRNFFSCIIEENNKITTQRNTLNSIYCFPDSFGYFKYLDKNKKNYIDINDLSNFLANNKIKCTKSQLNKIMKLYDLDCDSCWNFEEYSSFINKDTNNLNHSSNIVLNSSIDKYEKELANLFLLEIHFLQYVGIKAKSIKEIMSISAKKIFEIMKQNNGKNIIDSNSLFSYLNDKGSEFKRESAEKIIKIISNGKNFITEKQLDNLFKYDKFITENDIQYTKRYPTKNYDVGIVNNSTQFPLNDYGVLYTNNFNQSQKMDDYITNNLLNSQGSFGFNGQNNNNNLYNTAELNGINNINSVFRLSNSNLSFGGEHGFTVADFSFGK